jgi:hypothetical protein
MTGKTRTALRWRRLTILGSIAILAAACGSSGTSVLNSVGNSVGGNGGSDQTGSKVVGQPAASAAPPIPAAGPGGVVVSPVDLLVVKTGNLALQVKAVDAALAEAGSKIAALGGYVSGSERTGDGQSAVASVTYRIPAARWDDALTGLRGLALKVLGEQTHTDEVTGQVLDLGARISNLQATERALQAIMDKAVKISDVLEVQSQLTNVRGQIEQLETEKQHLQEQAAYGTLSVTFGLETVALVEAQKDFDPETEADRATASLVEVGQALATAGIWFGILWLPILLVLGLIGLVVVVLFRRYRRSHPGSPGASGGGGAWTPAAPAAPPAES